MHLIFIQANSFIFNLVILINIGCTGSLLKLLSNNTVTVQSDSSGDLIISNLNLQKITTIPATRKNCIEGDKRFFRHSNDSRHLAWVTSEPQLSLVDLTSMQPGKIIPTFWRPAFIDTSAFNIKPVSLTSNIEATEIVGLANVTQGTGPLARDIDQIIYYCQPPAYVKDYQASQLFPNGTQCVKIASKIFCLEGLRSGKEFLAAGIEKALGNTSSALIYKCKLETYIPIVSCITIRFNTPIYEIRKLRRLPGTDNFLIACDNHLALHDMSNDRTYFIENVHTSKIADFSVNSDTIMTKDVGKGPFVMIKLDDAIAHVYQPNTNLMMSAKSVSGLEQSPEPRQREISPFQVSRNPSPAANKQESGFLTPPINQNINFSALSHSKIDSPRSDIESSGLQKSTVLYKQGEYDMLKAHKFTIPTGESMEKITVNKKFSKIFCGGHKVYLLTCPPSIDQISPEIFTSGMQMKEIYGIRI